MELITLIQALLTIAIGVVMLTIGATAAKWVVRILGLLLVLVGLSMLGIPIPGL